MAAIYYRLLTFNLLPLQLRAFAGDDFPQSSKDTKESQRSVSLYPQKFELADL
jgi:hypothetical protein